MTYLKKSPVFILAFLALSAVLVGLGQATTTNINIKPGEEVTYPIKLIPEDRVLIQFTVVGQTESALNFSITFPNGNVSDSGELSRFSYSFVCDQEGECVLRFVNTDQMENKLVTLNYEIDHYVFGMPQMLFMTLFIVLACIGGVVAYVMIGKKP